ncbi:MAG: GAF domain-containing sensor histidine kinase [Cyanobacteria bacterium P01_F01_bin.53]
MQTSESLIAYQLFSLAGYQRLRKALLQQQLFSTVVTESLLGEKAQWEKTQWIRAIKQSLGTSRLAANIDGRLESAVQQGTPQEEAHFTDRPANGEQLKRFQMVTQSLHRLGDAIQNNAKSSTDQSQADLAAQQYGQQYGQSFVLMSSPSLNVLLTASPIQTDGADYQVGLTFDDDAIASFLTHLQHEANETGANETGHANKLANAPQNRHENTDTHHHSLGNPSQVNPSQGNSAPAFQSTLQTAHTRPTSHTPARHTPENTSENQHKQQHSRSQTNHSRSSQRPIQGLPNMSHSEASSSSPEQGHSKDPHGHASATEKSMAQKAFVLSWTKQLATSPEGDMQSAQATLNNQIEQNLLLNQVITQIRHSLDLPSILETTVAQVREFLSADRLVLYQIDQFDPIEIPPAKDVSNRASVEGTHDSMQQSSTPSDLQSPLGDRAASDKSSPLGQTPEPTVNPNALIGRRVHTGHVTYESRISEEIPSVLNYSEQECFDPSRLHSNRYLTGAPISIDNVDQQYDRIECLLDFLHQSQVKSEIITPIVVKGKLWGLLIVHQCQEYRHWEKTEEIFVQHIAEHLAVAISQASLYQQVREQTVNLESCVIERTQNLHDALLAAESANITKGEFLSTMSHELRTPLTYIIGMSATLLRWSLGVLNERQRSYLTTINQSGEKLLAIINNILEFANVESGRSLLDFSDLSLTQLVDTVAGHHQDMAEKQGVTLICDLKVTPEEDTFRADTKRLEQIIANLLHNAIKFTPAGGQVNVRVWRESNQAVVQVEDSGIGIPESQQDILFEKFKQLESPFQRQYSGTGLGLAMTKRLVELHGGSIQVESQVGKGSTFSVRLPTQAEQAQPPEHYKVPITEEGAERALLLETDKDNAAIVCEMLTAAGYKVVWLVDADDLANQLDGLRPVVMIANLDLLNQDLGDIKKIQLLLTTLDTKVLAIMGQQDGAPSPMAHHDILRTPIEPKVLLEKVRQLTVQRA